MRVEITATEKPERLKENITKRVSSSKIEDGKVVAETDETDFLTRTPGIDSFKVEGVKQKGIGGSPVEEKAYARLESREDAVRCLLATIEGYDLMILNTSREWDLRQLKKYNPDIKHLKFDEPKDFLEIEKSVSDIDEKEQIELEMPSEEEIEKIYRGQLT